MYRTPNYVGYIDNLSYIKIQFIQCRTSVNSSMVDWLLRLKDLRLHDAMNNAKVTWPVCDVDNALSFWLLSALIQLLLCLLVLSS